MLSLSLGIKVKVEKFNVQGCKPEMLVRMRELSGSKRDPVRFNYNGTFSLQWKQFLFIEYDLTHVTWT